MAATTSAVLSGGKIIAAIKASGVDYILSVPDIVTSSGLLAPIADDKALRLVRVCKEDECIGIASGLSYSDTRALISSFSTPDFSIRSTPSAASRSTISNRSA